MNRNLGQPIDYGRTSEIYFWKEGEVLKLFYDWFSLENIEREAHVSRAVWNIGLPVPYVGEILCVNNRYGLVYQRVYGKSIWSTIRHKPWYASRYARRCAEIQAELHVSSTAAAEVSFAPRTDTRVSVTASHFDESIDQNQSTDYLRTRRDTLDAELAWRVASQVWNSGAMVTREQASSRSYGDEFQSDTNTVNLYVQDQLDLGPHRALAAIGYTDHETAGSAWTWNLEYGYTLAGATLLYALGGTGYRVPDATDRYVYGGNPDLDAERSFNVEAGMRHRISGAQSVSLAWFRNQIDNCCSYVRCERKGPGRLI